MLEENKTNETCILKVFQ